MTVSFEAPLAPVPVLPRRRHLSQLESEAIFGLEFRDTLEIHVDADVETCQARDPKGLYAKASDGRIGDFTGISAPYEVPERPEPRIATVSITADEAAELIIGRLRQEHLIQSRRGRRKETVRHE